jgi:adenylyltransferase and sulfurtransferase
MSDRLLMYDALQCSFARIKKPPRQPKCPACSGEILSMKDSYEASQMARGPSCLAQRQVPEVPPQNEVSVHEYDRIRQQNIPHVLLDVRVKEQFDLCRLQGAVNVPLASLSAQRLTEVTQPGLPVYFVCRRGIASAMAVNKILQEKDAALNRSSIKHIEGGLDKWRAQIDRSFPEY